MSAMHLTLYSLADEYVQAIEALPEMGLDEQTIADTLEGLQGTLMVKAQNVAAYCLNLEAEADAVEALAEKLKTRARAARGRTQALRDYLHTNMARTNLTEIKANDGTFTAKIKQNPPSVIIDDLDALPAIYLREIPAKFEPEKTAIKRSLQAGEMVPGARLVQSTRLELK